MFNKNKIVPLIVLGVLVLIVYTALNIKLSTQYVIIKDNRATFIVKEMPFYVKAIHFLSRHYQYKVLAEKITKGCNSDTEKVLAIFDWTVENIKRDIPPGWPIVDDHPASIIIRGYGSNDQMADVFSVLCEYAGIPATMYNVAPKETPDHWHTIGAAYIDNRWLLFDPYFGKYFKNDKGEIASVEDVMSNPALVRGAICIRKDEKDNTNIEGYAAYFNNLRPVRPIGLRRTEAQMPLPRLIYTSSEFLKINKKQ